jgi:malonate transporter and related proteins
MTLAILYKLLAIVLTVALGWAAGRMRWLGDASADPARVLSNVAFYIFVPALLFRTTARIDFATMPWALIAAFFVPQLLFMLAVYASQRRRARAAGQPALASTRAITASFGNTVQVGIPMAAALFGEAGLAMHITVVSLHALTLLSVLTVLVELDLARAGNAGNSGEAGSSLADTLKLTVRNTVIHPVVLPVLAGLVYNAAGLRLHAVVDEVLVLLASAVVPLCLVLIGLSLAYYGLPKRPQGAAALAAGKLVVLPLLVLVAARFGFGISGLPLAVIVMMAALPVGSNALIFAQRYRTLESEATAAIVFSTLSYMATAPLWLALLGSLAPWR